MVGRGVLLECLDHSEVSEVLCIVRKPTGESHPKLKELVHPDFNDFSSVKEQLKGYDACFACMGVSAAGMSEEQYTKLTYDYTLGLAKELVANNPSMTFTYVSGVGTDSSEKGRMMWASVKGKTENDLLKLGFNKAFMFRPGGVIPKRGAAPKAKTTKIAMNLLGWILPIIKALNPNSITDTNLIGKAMINAHLKGYNEKILTPKDINLLAEL